MNPINDNPTAKIIGGYAASNVGGIDESLKLRIPPKLRFDRGLFAPVIVGIVRGQPTLTTDLDKNRFKLKVAAAAISLSTGIICYVPYLPLKDPPESEAEILPRTKKIAVSDETFPSKFPQQAALFAHDDESSLQSSDASFALFKKPLGESADILGIPDGHWLYETEEVDCSVIPSVSTLMEEAFTKDFMNAVLSLIIATKVTVWKENHHTGASNVGTYVRRIFEAQFKGRLGDVEPFITTIDTIGHWVSTRMVLHLMKVKGLAPVEPVIIPTATVSGMHDVALRISSYPAGTAKLFLAYKVGNQLYKSKYAKYCPNVEEFCSLKEEVDKVNSYPARYHTAGEYLCAHKCETFLKPEFSHRDYDRFLGRAGTYAKHILKGTTIKNSPHFRNLSNYPDFSEEFDRILSELTTR